MAGTARGYAERPGRYFFLKGVLYKKVKISRRQNLISAIRMNDEKHVTFLWSDVARDGQRAYHLRAVAEMLGCAKRTAFAYHQKGLVSPPTLVEYAPDHPLKSFRRHRLYSEDNIMEMWEVMANTHIGRPRRDGIIGPRKNLPSKAEMLSKLKGGTVIYYKDELGVMTPMWRAS